MRTYLQLIIITLCFVAFKTKAQCSTPISYSIQVTPPTCSVCCDGSAQVINTSGGCGAYLIQWSTTPTQYGLTASGLCSGSYSVTIYDSGCCPSVMQGCFVPQGGTTNINENYLVNNLSVFPNPVKSFLNIIDKQNEFQNSTIEIKNYLGQVVFTTPFIKQINISNIQSGIYFLTVQNSSIKKTVKIIKQ